MITLAAPRPRTRTTDERIATRRAAWAAMTPEQRLGRIGRAMDRFVDYAAQKRRMRKATR